MFGHLNTESKTEDFPERFSNQVYYSEDCYFSGFSYRSAYSLKYVHSGTETYLVEGRCKKIKTGQFMVVNDESQVALPESNISRAISIFLDPETIKEVMVSFHKNDGQLLEYPALNPLSPSPLFWEHTFNAKGSILGGHLEKVFWRMKQLVNGGNTPVIEKSFFYELAEMLFKEQESAPGQLIRLHTTKRSTQQEIYTRLRKAWEYIHDRADDNLGLENMAQAAAMSPYHFHRKFSMAFGMSPVQYHQRLKMEKARKWLTQDRLLIKDIAVLLGYADASSFGKAFRRVTGTSPSFMRKAR